MKRNQTRGFTLIELLVVIAIIGILVTIVIIAINPVRQVQNAQDSKMRADLNQIKAAMQLYYNDCKFYPLNAPTVNTAWTPAVGGAVGPGASANSCDDGVTYMRQFPGNSTGTAYLYLSTLASGGACADGTCAVYIVGAVLNNPASGTGADGLTVTKCGALGAANFEVCND